MPTISSAQQRIIVVQPKHAIQVVGALPGPQGPSGPIGPQGPQGPSGPNVPLGGLDDVELTGIANGNVVYWDLASQLWKPVAPALASDLTNYVAKSGATMTGGLTVPTLSSTGQANVYGKLYVADRVDIGDDAFFEDVNVANTLQITGVQNSSVAGLKFGTFANTIAAVWDAYMEMKAQGYLRFLGTAMEWKNVADNITFMNYSPGYGLYMRSGEWFRPQGNGGVYWNNHAGGWNMVDSTWIRAYNNKSIYTINASIATDGNGTSNFIAGNYTCDDPTRNKFHGRYDEYSHGRNWAGSHIVIHNAASVAYTQIAMHTFNVAPIIKTHYASESVEFQNNGGTGFIPIKASAFTVSSSLRVKKDVAYLDDDELLGKTKALRSIRFRNKIGPLVIRTSEEFKDVDARWQASGKSPLRPNAKHYESHDHDCSIDQCEGTPDSPCVEKLNDTEKIGLAAEELYEVLPEAVWLDAEGKPTSIDIAQVAGAALAGVGALTRRIEELEAQLKGRPNA